MQTTLRDLVELSAAIWYPHRMNLLTVKEASRILGVTVGRVHQLIAADRLPAEKLGFQYVIRKADLDRIAVRKPGRPARIRNVEQF